MATKQQKNKPEKVSKKTEKSETWESGNLLQLFWRKYSIETPFRLKLIDAFVVYLSSIIVWQLFYRYVVGNDFPKNAFLSGVFAPLGVIVMAVALRLQIGDNPPNRISWHRAFWEFLAGLLVLFVVIVNFLG